MKPATTPPTWVRWAAIPQHLRALSPSRPPSVPSQGSSGGTAGRTWTCSSPSGRSRCSVRSPTTCAATIALRWVVDGAIDGPALSLHPGFLGAEGRARALSSVLASDGNSLEALSTFVSDRCIVDLGANVRYYTFAEASGE